MLSFLLRKNKFLSSSNLCIGIFTQRASRSHHIGFVGAHSQYTNTASWATALPLQQSQLVNNPGKCWYWHFL
jgi:hypothetical protein